MTRPTGRKHKGIRFPNDGRTKQADSIDCDINVLMAKYNQTGDARILNVGNAIPRYGDFSNVPDFMAGQLQIKEAEALFMDLPAAIRSRFENQPDHLIHFMQALESEDPELINEALELGLVERPQGWKPEVKPVDVTEVESKTKAELRAESVVSKATETEGK